MNFTGGDYFRAMGIQLLQGRAFTDEEAVTPNNSVIISRSAAEKLWPGQNALGPAHPAPASAVRTRSRSRSSASWTT